VEVVELGRAEWNQLQTSVRISASCDPSVALSFSICVPRCCSSVASYFCHIVFLFMRESRSPYDAYNC